MKKHMRKLAFACLAILSTVASSCDGGDDENTVTPPGSIILQEGKWSITYYFDKTKEETYHFDGYTFEFGTNGSLTAVKGTDSVLGKWLMTTSNSPDEITIDFGASNPFDELNEDWKVEEKTSLNVRLSHESGSGGIEKVTFTRIKN